MFSFLHKTMSDNSKTFFDFKINSINGDSIDLSTYIGKTTLLVNVASNCGFTKQYDDLQKLYDRFKDKGLIIVGVPTNQFGGQEPEIVAIYLLAPYALDVNLELLDRILL